MPIVRRRTAIRSATPRTVALVAAGLAGLLLAALGQVPAHAAVPASAIPGGFESWPELMAYQARMIPVADRLNEIGHRRGVAGFAGLVVDPALREVHLYWHGAPPKSVRDVVAQSAATMPVKVLPAAYTEAQMLAETDRIVASPGMASVTSVGPSADGSGVRLAVLPGTVVDTPARTALTAQPASRVVASTMVAKLEYTGRYQPGVGRQDDSSPFWGGSRYHLGFHDCTTGFGIHWNGNTRILTAAHCGTGTAYTPAPNNRSLGNTINRVPNRDLMMLDGRAQGFVYDGDPTTGVSKRVNGISYNFVGQYRCLSGSFSGTICGIAIDAINQTVPLTGVGNVSNEVKAHQVNAGQSAGGEGDSGGAVFSLSGSYISANGIFSGGLNTVPCSGLATTCWHDIIFADMHDAMGLFGASVITQP